MRVHGGGLKSRESEFEEVAPKALAKDPKRHFASMSDITAALEQACFADDSGALTHTNHHVSVANRYSPDQVSPAASDSW